MTTVANSEAEANKGARPAFTPVDPELAAFIYLEARLADESRYSEWEALWDDDACYWVPMREDHDPRRNLSYIYDNRRRLHSRIAQLNTGSRHAQTPPSRMRRTVSNLEVLAHDGDTVTIGSNFALHEYRHELTVWAGRYVHRIRTGPDGPRLVAKTVHLVNGHGAVPTLAFLI
ncbi:aromatic-ring-hydroxylating dioxygenase subunit beta [Streptomyces sp. NPDC056660]|uniref:aromatic-ring-hydroxylating dioxygenase subunit beta n=1 Tax=Streptomyces sp. NPDC056660 TaxID=3345897 RepID=UPI0036A450BB